MDSISVHHSSQKPNRFNSWSIHREAISKSHPDRNGIRLTKPGMRFRRSLISALRWRPMLKLRPVYPSQKNYLKVGLCIMQ